MSAPKYFNARAYGAAGDGSIDDTIAIQSAIHAADRAGGGTVYLPKGTYRVSAQILVEASDIALLGQSRFETVIKPDADANLDRPFQIQGEVGSPITNITVGRMSMDATNRPAESRFGQFRIQWVDFLSIHDMYGEGGFAGLYSLENVNHFQINQIQINDWNEGTISLLTPCKFGTITDIEMQNVGEVVDMGGCEEIVISNVRALGDDLTQDEAFDMGQCKRIVLANAVIDGFRSGVVIKTEGSSPTGWNDITIVNCQFYGFGGVCINAQASGATEAVRRLRVANSTFISTEAGAAAVEVEPGQSPTREDVWIHDCTVDVPGNGIRITDWRNARVERCEVTSGRFGIRIQNTDEQNAVIRGNRVQSTSTTATDAAIQVDHNRYAQIVENHVISSTVGGINLRNCLHPEVVGNRVDECPNGHAINVQWENTDFLDATNNIIGAVIDGNLARNFGDADTSNRVGIRFSLDIGSEHTGTYNVASISDNRIWIDEEGVKNSQRGIRVAIGDLTEIDYAKVDNNLIYNTSAGIVGVPANLGANSTNTNNTIFTA